VWEDLEAWRSRPLEQAYAVIYLDAVFFRVRGSGDGPRNKGSKFESRASFTVYAIDFAGNRDILGLYLMESEGAMAWGRVLEDLQRRGVEEVFCFCVDGLSGFADVIRNVYPKSIVQRCIVHQTRHTTRFCADADVKKVRSDLRKIYTAITMEEALSHLKTFKEQWDKKYPKISESWEANWEDLMAFLEFPEDLRRIIYTTNPVEAVHRIIRKLIKGKAAWSSESGLYKQLYLSLMHNTKSWQRKAHKWKSVQLVFEHYDNGYWSKYLRS
jgi:transposase-like protein